MVCRARLPRLAVFARAIGAAIAAATILTTAVHAEQSAAKVPDPASTTKPSAEPRDPFVRLVTGLRTHEVSRPDICHADGFATVSARGLRRTRRQLRERRQLRILAIGSSSTVGIGATSRDKSYPAWLSRQLMAAFGDRDIKVSARGLSGEVAIDMANRLRIEVGAFRPHLVLWQVGTNAAIARLPASQLADILTRTIRWLKSHQIDIALINPQYTVRLGQDPHYVRVVNAINDVAAEEQTLLINRYSAMEQVAKSQSADVLLARDRFHMNDRGYLCLASYVSRAMIAGILRAEDKVQRASATVANPATENVKPVKASEPASSQ